MLRYHLEKNADATLATIEVPLPTPDRFGIVGIDGTDRVVELPGEADAAADGAGRAGRGARLDGHLHLQGRCAGARAGRRCDARGQRARLRQKHHPVADSTRAPVFAYRFYDENKKSVEVLAGHRNDRRVFRCEHGSLPGEPRVQPLRPRMAAANLSAAGAAGQVRLRRTKAAVAARRSTRSSRAAASSPEAGSADSILCPNVRVHSFCDIDQAILMPGVRVGRHARIHRAIIDRDVLIPRGALIGFDPEEDRRRHTVTESGRRRRDRGRRSLNWSDQRGGAARGGRRGPQRGGVGLTMQITRLVAREILDSRGNHERSRPRDPRFSRQSHGGSRCLGWRRSDVRPCHRARRPVEREALGTSRR